MAKLLLFFLAFFAFQPGFSQSLKVLRLKCENNPMPLAVEKALPLLSWQLKSKKRNVTQTAYRILVADDSLLLTKNKANVWDSKNIHSNASINVRYAGQPLLPAKNYYWKIFVWDNRSAVTQSKIARWQTGLFGKEDWKSAKWIAYEKLADSNVNVLPTDGKKDTYTGSNVLPLFRKPFVVKSGLQSASLFICGLGQFEASLNGKKIGDHFLDPGWTKYDKQALYVPFDVTANVKNGRNVLGVMLGNGFYYVPPVPSRYRKLKSAFGYPKLICRLLLRYNDGTTQDVVSDESWKTFPSPVAFSSIYGGEDYDATREQLLWDSPQFNDESFRNVMVVDGPPVLNAQTTEPLRVMQRFLPNKMNALNGDTLVYDLGQNFSGIVQIKLQGKRGDTVRIYPGELLKANGTVSQRGSGGPYYWQYVLRGDCVVTPGKEYFSRPQIAVDRNGKLPKAEAWQPKFTYYGFRYLQVVSAAASAKQNPKGLPVVLQIAGLHTRADAAATGNFNCSNELFNKTATLIDWAIKSNAASVSTDCPHREKLGWLEQTYLMGNSVHYGYDAANLFRKTVTDMRYSQLPNGLMPEIAPEYVKFDWGDGMFRDSPEWGSACIILPWYLYQWYGDKEVLQESYEMMKRYLEYLQTKANGNVLSQGLGDWYDIGPKPPGTSQQTPMGVTGTAIYHYDLSIAAKVASLLGHDNEAAAYEKKAVEVRQSFNDSFYHPETRQYATGSQTANAMAVYFTLVDSNDKAAVVENIVKDIDQKGLTTGDIGYRFLLAALHEAGRDDVIYKMNNRSDVPGYGYQLLKGATALTESWQALPAVSNNHLMLGHLMEWFYGALGGIGQTAASVAYKEIKIDPNPVGDVAYTNVSYECPYGLIKAAWTNAADSFHLDVEIPANSTAIVYLPATGISQVRESGKRIGSTSEIKFIGTEKEKIKLKLGSGLYHFLVDNKSGLTDSN